MIKKVPTQKLIPGVYVQDLNCPWFKHPFLLNQFKIKDQSTIERLQKLGINEVYIDTSRGSDIVKPIHIDEVREKIGRVFESLEEEQPHFRNRISREEELPRAKGIKEDANQLLQQLMNNVRVGEKIKIDKALEIIDNMIDSVERNRDALISLLKIKEKHQYTFLHSISVSVLSIAFAKTMKLPDHLIREYGLGALLHDIGKMMIPNEILDKPSYLTKREFLKVKEHAVLGHSILTEMSSFAPKSLLIVLQHHERSDGSGYPYGLMGGEISQGGQMTAIADVYDAITSERSYSKGIQPVEALRKLYNWGERFFDSEKVQHFIHSVGIYPVGTLVKLRCGLLAIVVETGRGDLKHPVIKIFYNPLKRRFVTRRIIDLSQSHARGYGNDIVSIENPLDWNINPSDFLDLRHDQENTN